MKYLPKKNKLAIPGVGVVEKKDFTQAHLRMIKAWASENNLRLESILAKHFDAVSDSGQIVLLPGYKDTEPFEDIPVVVADLERIDNQADDDKAKEEKHKRKRRTKAEIEADKEAK